MNSLALLTVRKETKSKTKVKIPTRYPVPHAYTIYTVPYRKQTGNERPMNEGVEEYVLHTAKFGQTFLQILGYWVATEPFDSMRGAYLVKRLCKHDHSCRR